MPAVVAFASLAAALTPGRAACAVPLVCAHCCRWHVFADVAVALVHLTTPHNAHAVVAQLIIAPRAAHAAAHACAQIVALAQLLRQRSHIVCNGSLCARRRCGSFRASDHGAARGSRRCPCLRAIRRFSADAAVALAQLIIARADAAIAFAHLIIAPCAAAHACVQLRCRRCGSVREERGRARAPAHAHQPQGTPEVCKVLQQYV
jgi:hypothetical protein